MLEGALVLSLAFPISILASGVAAPGGRSREGLSLGINRVCRGPVLKIQREKWRTEARHPWNRLTHFPEIPSAWNIGSESARNFWILRMRGRKTSNMSASMPAS
jgi:hypothetical protein